MGWEIRYEGTKEAVRKAVLAASAPPVLPAEAAPGAGVRVTLDRDPNDPLAPPVIAKKRDFPDEAEARDVPEPAVPEPDNPAMFEWARVQSLRLIDALPVHMNGARVDVTGHLDFVLGFHVEGKVLVL